MTRRTRHLLLIAVIAALGSCGSAASAQGPGSVLNVLVTGNPAPVETLRDGALAVTRAWLPPWPRARLDFSWTNPPLAPLPGGSAATVNVGFLITAPGFPPLPFAVPIALTNATLPWFPAQELLVSDDPETVEHGGVLNEATLGASQTVRLLYHHQNGSRVQAMTFAVKLTNAGPDPATLVVTAASGGPASNELLAGHTAAHWFLAQYWRQAGFVLALRPASSFVLWSATVPPQDVVSGLVQLSVRTGSNVRAEVVSDFPGAEEFAPAAGAAPSGPAPAWSEFPDPLVSRAASYTAGGFTSLALGAPDDLVRVPGTGATLLGNYGVVYRFAVSLDNPTADPAVAALVMHADSGEAQGTFLVDGRVIEGPIVEPNAPRLITTFALPPQSHRTVEISTMPESGAYYPARLTIGPAW